MAEQKNNYKGFIGPSYVNRVGRFDKQRSVNLYLEMAGTPDTKNNQPAVLIGVPGLDLLFTIGSGPIRGAYTVSFENTTYFVSGNKLYRVQTQPDHSYLTPELVGALSSFSGPVSMADNGTEVLLVDGYNGYYSTIADATPTLTTIVDPNFFPANVVTFQDGYFILNKKGTPYFFISDLYSVDFLPLNEANKSGQGDNIIGLISNNRQVYLFGDKTTEIWWDSGQSGSTPFARQDGKFMQTGCASPASIQRMFNTVIWVGQNEQGGAIVYMVEGEQPKRISNHAVEYSIQNLGSAIDTCTAYTWQLEGHSFYVLNVDGLDMTWVYDLSTGQWFEMQSLHNGVKTRHPGQVITNFGSRHIVGDYRSGNVYEYNFDTYTNNGDPIPRMRQAPHIAANLNRIFYNLLEIDFTPGVGLEGGTNPRVSLEISNDGGETWSNPIFASLGKIGKYTTRARWQRLGSSRDRVFRVSCSDPVKFNLLSAMLDLEQGTQ